MSKEVSGSTYIVPRGDQQEFHQQHAECLEHRTDGGGAARNTTYLPLVLMNRPPVAPTGVTNGDFEDGATGWVEYSTHGWDLIVTSSVALTPSLYSGRIAAEGELRTSN